METARHARPAGTPPRSVLVLASLALFAATATALWLLPGRPLDSLAGSVTPPLAARPAIVVGSPPPAGGPAPRGPAYVAFVDAVRDPEFNLPAAFRRTGVGAYTLGHVSSGPDGCTPTWGGQVMPNPLVGGLDRLRAEGGDAGLAFGGPAGRELSATCADADRLLAAYRGVIAAYRPAALDFEVHDSADPVATARRAKAVARLQREFRAQGRPLTVTFTLPASTLGLSPEDRAMLRRTRQAGVDISTVNLLVPFAPGSSGNVRRLLQAAKSTHGQLGWALGGGTRATWRRIGLTPLLAAPQDLTPLDARRLLTFQARYNLAWLSVRGATPTDEVSRTLISTPSPPTQAKLN
ncbi:hypothetical protein Aph01nite_65200 [Acrocarpospora phusangensis]|uniref:GH18 domain-containing protein n=1 Tax=Acrocarpospora phusangensis TaxID=1070424 RepID=A0A919QKY4_9ACTN|nr:hypothetical protein [Acrocarpospora phusangensis]GIH28210.1 hypothetical protein Aph01nite_65200 [Acrocarpospora phusangensis]